MEENKQYRPLGGFKKKNNPKGKMKISDYKSIAILPEKCLSA